MGPGHRVETGRGARWWPPPRTDALLAGGLLLLQLSGALAASTPRGEPELTVGGALFIVAQTLPVAWRTRAGLLVWAVTGLATIAYGIAELPDQLVPLGALVALATVVERAPRRQVVAIVPVTFALAVSGIWVAGDGDALDYWFALALLLLAVVAGDRQRARRAYLREVEDRVARAEDDRRRDVREARVAERARLARELHDVVAHHVSMMVVQAEAGAATVAPAAAAGDEAAGAALGALDGVSATGRGALAELRRLLGVLRTDDGPSPTAPQPGLDQLPALVDQVRTAGLDVDVRVDGEPRPLAAAVEVSAYRVVQEGLTNVLKHAGAARATVVVRYGPDALGLEVGDDGPGAAAALPGAGGFGLAGLRERVELLHGTLQAGERPGGGFLLDVRLPLP